MARRQHADSPLHRTTTTGGRNDRWYIRYRMNVLIGPGETERKERTEYFGYCREVGKRAAEGLRAAFLRELNNPKAVISSQARFGEVIDAYLTFKDSSVRPETARNYRLVVDKHIRQKWGETRMCDITAMAVQFWLLEVAKKHTRKSAQGIAVQFAQIWKQAIIWGYTTSICPAMGATLGTVPGRPPRRATIPTIEEFNQFTSLLAQPARTIVSVAAFTGMRISEILAIRWEDLRADQYLIDETADKKNGVIREWTKTKKSRRLISIRHVREQMLATRPADAQAGDPVFPIRYAVVLYAVKKAAHAIGIDYEGFGCHTFRRFHVTHFRAIGSAQDAMDQVGHGDLRTNETYRQPLPEDQERLADTAARLMGRVVGRVQ